MRFAGPWGAVHQTELRRIARSPDAGPGHMRLFMLALAEANQIGHAEFAPNVLREFLGTVNKASGRVKLSAASTVSDAIDKAKRLGMFHEDSCARCLVLPRELFQKAGRGTGSCTYHEARTRQIRPTV
ncbi:hypothetical protein FXF53_27425 [Micromonospora sp. WP24]|nr:hypothetical protein FXF53_27425 [Micromonospora sp. WP24]